MAFNSRSQSKCERVIGTLTRLICKLQTENPDMSFLQVVEEGVISYNSAPHTSLPRCLSPREMHFIAPTPSFLDVNRPETRDRATARTTMEETAAHEVAAMLRRRQRFSPTNYSAKLKIGDVALKRRTSFPKGVPKKLAFQIEMKGYVVMSKVATNAFRCRDVMSGETVILPGDLLVRLRHHSEESVKRLVAEMSALADGPKKGTLRTRSEVYQRE